MSWGWVEMLDAINNIVGHVDAGLLGVVADDESHFEGTEYEDGGIDENQPGISVSWLVLVEVVLLGW